jgi:hypothetical protein
MINTIVILRYLQLAQKYGYGLINLKDVTFTENTTPAVSYEESLSFFEMGISLLNKLSEDELNSLKDDNAAYIKVIHRYEILSQEWELFNHENDSERSFNIAKEIESFRKKFIKASLLDQLNILLETDKIKNVGFVVRFYSLLVWHGICLPIDALKKLASYKFLVSDRCEAVGDCNNDPKLKDHESEKIRHYRNYHRNNMIQQLFRIYRDEPIYSFHKVRLHFEQLTQTTFKINHFSDTVIGNTDIS